MLKTRIKFKGVYVVQNYGSFRELFYYYEDAKRFVEKVNAEKYYQIYKCDVVLENIVPKNKSAKEALIKLK